MVVKSRRTRLGNVEIVVVLVYYVHVGATFHFLQVDLRS